MADDDDFALPRPHPALKRLGFLVGSWRTSGTLDCGAMVQAGTLSGEETFEWLHGGFFLVHRWRNALEVGEATVVDAGYEFLDFEPLAGIYRAHLFSSLGPYHATNSKYHGDFDGSALVLVGPARVTRRPYGADRIRHSAELPDGRGGWTPWLRGWLTRTGTGGADGSGGERG